MRTLEPIPSNFTKPTKEMQFADWNNWINTKEFLDHIRSRMNIDRSEWTHSYTFAVLNDTYQKLHEQLEHEDSTEADDEIEDIAAKFVDLMEKLITPYSLTKQVIMVGRDKEFAVIKDELLSDKPSVIVIAGEPGTGKTLLAQCLHEDADVCKSFDFRDWINIYSIERDKNHMMIQLNEIVENTLLPHFYDEGKGLIVLDGSMHTLNDIVNAFPKTFMERIKIVLTTSTRNLDDLRPSHRSGDIPSTLHVLEGLVEEDSRALFESLACLPFETSYMNSKSSDERIQIHNDYENIRMTICKMCANNPRVITTMARILSTKSSLDEWKQLVHQVVWSSLHDPVERIQTKVNFESYQMLPFDIKQCLTYCSSLFPKDYEFKNTDLNLWLGGDDEELPSKLRSMFGYFTEHRKLDDNSFSYKMPNLNYEFIKYVANKDLNTYQLVDSVTKIVDTEIVRHVSFMINGSFSWRAPGWLLATKKLRTLVFLGEPCEFNNTDTKILPSVRYLRLDSSSKPTLPEFITRMENLRVLDLQRLNNIEVLPEKFHELHSLRHLGVSFKPFVDHGRPNYGEIIRLGNSNVLITGQNDDDGFTLADWNNLIGDQMLPQTKGYEVDKLNEIETMNIALKDVESSNIVLKWLSPTNNGEDIVLRTLQAPDSLRSVSLTGCLDNQLKLPRFRNLSSILIMDCNDCEYFPSLKEIPKLKHLKMCDLGALKYVLEDDAEEGRYLQYLETLTLANLPKLKAWSKIEAGSNSITPIRSGLLYLPCLVQLKVSDFTNMTFMPLTPNLVSLTAEYIPMYLLKRLVLGWSAKNIVKLNMYGIRGLDSLPINIPSLESLRIRNCHELVTLSIEPPTCLKLFEIQDCRAMEDLQVTLDNVTTVEELEISCCEELDLCEKMPWNFFKKLRYLKLNNMTQIKSLSSSIGCLATLEQLSLCWLYYLKEIPEWIGYDLGKLHRLSICYCPNLTTLPASLGRLLSQSKEFNLDLCYCPRLKKLPSSFPYNNDSSQLRVLECPILERTINERVRV